jgi:pyruvate dehydrogenase E1 component beta subunit
MPTIMTLQAAIGKTVIEEMRRDPTIFIFGWMCGGAADTGGTIVGYNAKAVIEEFGRTRISYTGICETQEAGSGIGAALTGTRPIVDFSFSDFALDGWGQIALQAPKMRFKLGYQSECPVIFAMTIGGYDGSGSVHHYGTYHNWLANCPSMFVVIPTTPADAVGLWRTALRVTKDPTVMILDRKTAPMRGPVPDGDYTIPFGKADVKREGKDVTIAATGYWVSVAVEAANDLAKEGISAEVWDPRTLMPFDRKSLLASVKKTGALVAVDQAPKSFGTTGEFMATVGEALTPVPPMARVASMDSPLSWSNPLELYVLPSKEKIIKAAREVIGRKRG